MVFDGVVIQEELLGQLVRVPGAFGEAPDDTSTVFSAMRARDEIPERLLHERLRIRLPSGI